MAIYIYDPDAYEKIAMVEGEGFYENQSEYNKEITFYLFLKKWQEETQKNPELIVKGTKLAMILEDYGAIHGLGGVNRYIVFYSGEIVFHPYQSVNPTATKKAEEVGFRIF